MMRRLPRQESDERVSQEAPEYLTHSFIVKVWVEEASSVHERTTWRGRITHVPDGERRYLQSLKEITMFIAIYLNAMGVRPGVWQRIKEWVFQSFNI